MFTIQKTIYLPLFCFSFFLALIACQQHMDSTQDSKLSEKDFTPLSEINPDIYFATDENKANDPNNALAELFRQKKAADKANPEKPRPFGAEDMSPLENISYLQSWTPLDSVFRFDWAKVEEKALAELSKVVRTRLIFDNPDLKVVEMAIAAGGVLPLHAQATPSVYHILGGDAEVVAGDSLAKVYTGTSIHFDSYTQKRVKVTSAQPLKVLWFSWAPKGDKTYLESGYYLTGSNVHIQPIEAVLPENFDFWKAEMGKKYKSMETADFPPMANSDFTAAQNTTWKNLETQRFYPATPAFRSASEVDWVDVVNLDPKSFFFAKDIQKLGSTLNMLSRIAKIKSVFRVKRPDSGYDLNYSYLAWGPRSKYVTHSHAICEFYYLLEGDVEYIIEGQKFHAVPGNFYFHPPYYDHEMLGLKTGVPFLSISGSWIPFGKRALFEKPFLLLEEIGGESDGVFPEDFDFHDFEIDGELEYGVL